MNDLTHEDDPPGRTPPPLWATYLTIALAILLVFGAVTWALGLGPFAYRQIWYGTSEVYILNMSAHAVEVSLDSGTPRTIEPESADRTPILGGTTHIVTHDTNNHVIETLEVFVDGTPIFYNVAGVRCLVVADVTSYYEAGNKGVVILDTIPKGTQIVRLPHENIIWPRQTLRDEVSGGSGVAWIEIVACSMIEETERHILRAHLDFLLTERKRRQQEIAKQREINRLMMKGDSEGVTKIIDKKIETVEGPDGGPKGASDGESDAGPR